MGVLDELGSFLGVCKVKTKDSGFKVGLETFEDIIFKLQKDLFIIQAEVAGAEKTIQDNKVSWLEENIAEIEKILPPIHSFTIAGETDLSSNFDFARTLARRAERRVIAVVEEGMVKISEDSSVYLNRLSSLLYALARLSAHISGKKEESPDYR
jgi:cob(I)alamin adenosyltransferase